MNKKIIIIVVVVGVLILGFYFFNSYIYKEKQAVVGVDHKNAEYIVDGTRVKLVNGVSEVESAPGSASKVITKYFGNEVKKDLDGDGREDIVFLLTQQTGGSGTFYYVVASLNKEGGYLGSEALLLGDRIAPQTTESGKNKTIVVNYADRKPGESFAVQPSVGKSIILLLDPVSLQFGEVVKDFEGEADPSRMSLTMKKWEWIRSEYNDGRVITPKIPGKFTLTFKTDKSFSATTDCNGLGGEYDSKQSAIIFKNMISTLMYCEGSQESDFVKMLENTSSYHFTSKGELILDLKYDSGSVIFR